MTTLWNIVSDVRLLFLIEPPANMQYRRMEDTPAYIIRAIPCFALLAILDALTGWLRGHKGYYRLNDASMSINLGIFQQTVKLWTESFVIVVYLYIHDHYALVQLPCDSWLTWVALVLASDIAYYWFHRFAHEFHFLWAAHSVHHSGEDYNLATALRQGALQGATSWVFYTPLLLFFHPACVVAHGQLHTLFQFWIHTSVVGDLGPLERWLNTASHHRMHHRPPGNCNYSGVFIVWDRIFGTFIAEDKQIDHYGLASQYTTFDPVWANLEHAFRVFTNVGSGSRGIFSRLIAFFKRRVVHRWVFEPLELVRPLAPHVSLWTLPSSPKRRKLGVEMPVWVSVWIVVILVECMVHFMWLSAHVTSLPIVEQLMHSLWISLSVSASGRLCDCVRTGLWVGSLSIVGGGALAVARSAGVVDMTHMPYPDWLLIALSVSWTTCVLLLPHSVTPHTKQN
eukprot:c834_g1_i1.p1 GENE.c834_g1_i1~~c834_g1_i1.p1  ORF type:complete len:453 (+),score=97.77 c834_g1_i1:75-1433(+)